MKRMDRIRSVGRTWGLASLAALSMALTACNTTPKDETAGMSVEKLYAEARDEAASGGYERALKLYERLEGRAAGTLLSQQAQLERAYINFRTGEKAQALAIVERFLKLNPTSPAYDYALYLQGVINFNDNLGLFGNLANQDLSERDQQASRDSFQSFKQLTEQFPNSKYTPDARIRMRYIVNTLAAYEVHVARYYLRRGANLAAVNRAQQVLQDFQQAPAAEEALSILVQGYDRLGLDQLRDDAARVLRQNFPNSSFIAALPATAAPK
ncbi:MAG TPA: outer membrane protein assembly factor BamD [Rhizobacter sp.]|nr:outer membrane protein assembly factor BamD [Rhizobacter sp.]